MTFDRSKRRRMNRGVYAASRQGRASDTSHQGQAKGQHGQGQSSQGRGTAGAQQPSGASNVACIPNPKRMDLFSSTERNDMVRAGKNALLHLCTEKNGVALRRTLIRGGQKSVKEYLQVQYNEVVTNLGHDVADMTVSGFVTEYVEEVMGDEDSEMVLAELSGRNAEAVRYGFEVLKGVVIRTHELDEEDLPTAVFNILSGKTKKMVYFPQFCVQTRSAQLLMIKGMLATSTQRRTSLI